MFSLHLSLLAVSLCVVMLSGGARATTMPLCTGTCDVGNCPPVDHCKCGTYKGWCGCCDFCYTCPGENCFTILNRPCAPGSKCIRETTLSKMMSRRIGFCQNMDEKDKDTLSVTNGKEAPLLTLNKSSLISYCLVLLLSCWKKLF
ncbi:hypothetical protein TNCT_60841 [Trichonephila clavata]|uniref:IGFBP N-terminal domain-containing protein n=1 Tax=Trichonephila clavata TaxID=2740835 RepID=A0A8X6KJK1_TRICU|nr:hypothetical protein TNCT_60841 [Trichonephila clavata]